MVCLLNSCLYVMFRSCFESLASVVPIKLVRAAHCGAPRIATHRTYMGSCRKKMTGSFQILDTAHTKCTKQRNFYFGEIFLKIMLC